MDVRIIQKRCAIPSEGFVVNVEIPRKDFFENDGVFTKGDIAEILPICQTLSRRAQRRDALPRAYSQGITNKSGTAPHPEAGGYGTGPDDRGIRFYYDWVRDHVGRYEYPRHIKAASANADRQAPRHSRSPAGADGSHERTVPSWLHPDRIAGRHRDHRDSDRTAPAGGPGGTRGGAAAAVHQQHQAARSRGPQLRRNLGGMPPSAIVVSTGAGHALDERFGHLRARSSRSSSRAASTTRSM